MSCIYVNGTTVTFQDSGLVAQTIGGVQGISWAPNDASENDTTNTGSTAKESCPGLPDNGVVTVNVTLDWDDVGQAAAYDAWVNQATRQLVITFPSGTLTTWTGNAWVLSPPYDGPDNDSIITGTITFRVSGAVTRS